MFISCRLSSGEKMEAKILTVDGKPTKTDLVLWEESFGLEMKIFTP